MVIRQQQLRAGASFWAFVHFQGLVQPETSDLAPMSSLPESARGTALASADYLHDLLRWSIGRFSKLSDLYAHMSDYMARLQETDNSSKKQFNELSGKIHELSNGLIGLSSSIRHTQEEQLKAAPFDPFPGCFATLGVPPEQEVRKALKLSAFNFRPYSLRRGGATFWFNHHGSMDRLLLQGRWA